MEFDVEMSQIVTDVSSILVHGTAYRCNANDHQKKGTDVEMLDIVTIISSVLVSAAVHGCDMTDHRKGKLMLRPRG